MYRENPGMYGQEPSAPARYAADLFAAAGAEDIVELGAGHGRDTLYFAERGFSVLAADFSTVGLGQLGERAEARGLTGRISTAVVDVREPLPFAAGSADAVFAHMLLCMELSTRRIEELIDEVRRTLRPGGSLVYTVRHTGDPHYGTGVAHGDDIHEHGGFAVHFFSRELVDRLAEGWILREVHAFEEGGLPRRLWRITMTVPAPAGD